MFVVRVHDLVGDASWVDSEAGEVHVGHEVLQELALLLDQVPRSVAELEGLHEVVQILGENSDAVDAERLASDLLRLRRIDGDRLSEGQVQLEHVVVGSRASDVAHAVLSNDSEGGHELVLQQVGRLIIPEPPGEVGPVVIPLRGVIGRDVLLVVGEEVRGLLEEVNGPGILLPEALVELEEAIFSPRVVAAGVLVAWEAALSDDADGVNPCDEDLSRVNMAREIEELLRDAEAQVISVAWQSTVNAEAEAGLSFMDWVVEHVVHG